MRNRARTVSEDIAPDSSEPFVAPLTNIEKIKKEIYDGHFINLDLIADTLVDEYTKLSK